MTAALAASLPQQRRRGAGLVLIAAGFLALVGNVLHPRFGGDDVAAYRQIASSTRYVAADVVLLGALLLLTVGLVGLAEALRATSALADVGRLLALIGGTIALAQTGIELAAVRQQARDFAGAAAGDRVGAFWSTNSLDRLSSALFATWVMVLLGLVPLVLGLAVFLSRRSSTFSPGASRWLGVLGGVAGFVCAGVGVFDLLHQDQGAADVPFLIGSSLLVAWVIGYGWAMSRPAT